MQASLPSIFLRLKRSHTIGSDHHVAPESINLANPEISTVPLNNLEVD